MAADKFQQMFVQLVIQNQQIAMIAMGKTLNPVTNKVDRNLEYAKVSIDTLDMLAAKTKGNLTEMEQKFLDEAIKEVKINYVAEIEKDKKNNIEEEKTNNKN